MAQYGVVYLPLIVLALIASKAHHHAWTYPERPWSNIGDDDLEDRIYRFGASRTLAKCVLAVGSRRRAASDGIGGRGRRWHASSASHRTPAGCW